MRGCESGCEEGADRGFVTAESAVVLPVLVMFTMALVWGLLMVAAQIQCVDAARTGARAAARQDPADSVVAVTREAAPRGAEVTVDREGDQVRVVVAAKPLPCTVCPSRCGSRPWLPRRRLWGRGRESRVHSRVLGAPVGPRPGR